MTKQMENERITVSNLANLACGDLQVQHFIREIFWKHEYAGMFLKIEENILNGICRR